jgi:L-serine dehydratase
VPLSILNDVLGPVMRGPSSSHTAGSYHIARLIADLLGEGPVAARFCFDPRGSYAEVYRQQGVDLAFAAGLMGWELTDDRFPGALGIARESGVSLEFVVSPLAEAEHPNTTEVDLEGRSGRRLSVSARSVGGGAVEITRVDGWPILLRGHAWEVLVETDEAGAGPVADLLDRCGQLAGPVARVRRDGRLLVHASRLVPIDFGLLAELGAMPGVARVRRASPIAFVKSGPAAFESAAEMVALAEARGMSLGAIALEYEAALLGLTPGDVAREIQRRFAIMRAAVAAGSSDDQRDLHLLAPSARNILRADAEGRLALGGLHTRAAARAMAVMHVNATMGVVCAAPTGGSAGAVPGVVVTLADEMKADEATITRALLAASAIGVILGNRATFAAEVAGCPVEIGAAGAMAAAAVVEAAGGSARQAADAAAIAFQNTMGSVCDLVQGMVEIPCHTRNAVAASSAFVCADLVMGGYENPIPLDETIDAVYAVGRMLPSELRCTARGGLAVTPSALKLLDRRASG